MDMGTRVVVDTRNGDQYEVYDAASAAHAVITVFEQRERWNWSGDYPEVHPELVEERYAFRCGPFLAVKRLGEVG